MTISAQDMKLKTINILNPEIDVLVENWTNLIKNASDKGEFYIHITINKKIGKFQSIEQAISHFRKLGFGCILSESIFKNDSNLTIDWS